MSYVTDLIGTIVAVKLDREFGFIEPVKTGDDVYFPAKEIRPPLVWSEQLKEQRVIFNLSTGRNGRLRACNVRAVQ